MEIGSTCPVCDEDVSIEIPDDEQLEELGRSHVDVLMEKHLRSEHSGLEILSAYITVRWKTVWDRMYDTIRTDETET